MSTIEDESNERSPRLDVELFIVHPTIDPAEITNALGLEPSHVHPVGAPRVTPRGRVLGGVYRDTRWRHSVRHQVQGQHFRKEVQELLERLVPHREFLHQLRATGGDADLIIQFLGDGYFGDEISITTLSMMIDLGLDFGIEAFRVPQN